MLSGISVNNWDYLQSLFIANIHISKGAQQWKILQWLVWCF